MVTGRPGSGPVDGSLPDLRNVWAGNVAEVLFGEVHLAQVVSVRPLGDEGRLTEGAFDGSVPARSPRSVGCLVDCPGEGEDCPRV